MNEYVLGIRSFDRLCRHIVDNGTEDGDDIQIVSQSLLVRNPVDRITTEKQVGFNIYQGIKEFVDLTNGFPFSTSILNNSFRTLNSTFTFMEIDGALDLFVQNAITDVFVNLPQDVFAFTMLQELFSGMLKLPLGKFHLNSAILCMEKDRIPSIDKMFHRRRWPLTMDDMPRLAAEDVQAIYDLFYTSVPERFFDALYKNEWSSAGSIKYAYSILGTAQAYSFRAFPGYHDDCRRAYKMIEDKTLKYVLRPFLKTAGVIIDKR